MDELLELLGLEVELEVVLDIVLEVMLAEDCFPPAVVIVVVVVVVTVAVVVLVPELLDPEPAWAYFGASGPRTPAESEVSRPNTLLDRSSASTAVRLAWVCPRVMFSDTYRPARSIDPIRLASNTSRRVKPFLG